MSKRTCSTIAAALLLGACIAAPAQAADKVRFITFRSASALAAYVAVDHGFFKKNGLDVTIKHTPNSTYQLTNLIDGNYDIASSAFDNYIAYNEGQTKAKTKRKADLVVFMGVTTQNLPMLVTHDIKTFADLRGQPVGVDAPNTAFAFVLYKMLEMKGLKMGDYKIMALGGTTKRWAAMKEGKVKAAIISGAYAAQASKFGMRRLADSQKMIGTYQGSSLGTQRSWLASHRKDAVAFVRADLEALAWAEKHHEAAAKSLQKRIKGLSDAAALKTVARVTSGKIGGLTLNGEINHSGLKTVVALREQYGKPKKDIGNPMRFVDTSILADAKKGM